VNTDSSGANTETGYSMSILLLQGGADDGFRSFVIFRLQMRLSAVDEYERMISSGDNITS
jgi:hypothetical protein